MTRGNIAVAAVVAGPAQYQRVAWTDIEPDSLGERPARPFHQIRLCKAAFNCPRLAGAHLGGGQDRTRRQGRHGRPYRRNVAKFHHCGGQDEAARSHASSVSNSAKQVAPLPDIRTKFVPGC